MHFTFKFSNDFGEAADACIRCGDPTRERATLAFPGCRITVWACRPCLCEIAFFFWFLHEFPLRAAFKARDCAEAGEPVVQYVNSFNWSAGNGTPQAPNKKGKCYEQ